MVAGKLDQRIIVDRVSVTRDALGQEVETWGELTTVWAMVKWVSDEERFSQAQLTPTQTVRFTIRSSVTSRAITPRDRVRYAGANWDIHGVKPTLDGRNRFIEISAAREVEP